MYITKSRAPSYAELRPLKPLTTSTFPVYSDLVERLLAANANPDAAVAHVLATCSGYAYSDSDTVSMIMARMGLNDNACLRLAMSVDVMFIVSSAFLVQSGDGRVVVLCYRGTEPVNLINWLGNADVAPESIPIDFRGKPGRFDVHGGFYRNVRATRYAVINALLGAVQGRSVLDQDESTEYPLEALYITGHSLGGAMAALMAVMLRTDPAYEEIARKLRAVYTYGQPMIGTRDLADACNADEFLGQHLVRYVYNHDIVPRLPPQASGAFSHFGRERHFHQRGTGGEWIDSDRPVTQIGSTLEFLLAPVTVITGAVRLLRNVPFPASWEDHLPQHYIAALKPPGVRTELGD